MHYNIIGKLLIILCYIFPVIWYNSVIIGGVAQLGERLVRIQEVMGSNPTVSTIRNERLRSIPAKPFLIAIKLLDDRN